MLSHTNSPPPPDELSKSPSNPPLPSSLPSDENIDPCLCMNCEGTRAPPSTPIYKLFASFSSRLSSPSPTRAKQTHPSPQSTRNSPASDSGGSGGSPRALRARPRGVSCDSFGLSLSFSSVCSELNTILSTPDSARERRGSAKVSPPNRESPRVGSPPVVGLRARGLPAMRRLFGPISGDTPSPDLIDLRNRQPSARAPPF
eukprot:gnl/Spiro4/2876_TR1413_c0_g1_i1.p1 gnl/Spiro4/2876_TR1413_c0_g1~~gnl/Spiro4/2876_TR1413_c0_g1_i1.p1  ORF type:complete len:201 (+),score=13.20 gnl/Spiro4/2876_TR1413_c0_g1_i1:74-676(+)